MTKTIDIIIFGGMGRENGRKENFGGLVMDPDGWMIELRVCRDIL